MMKKIKTKGVHDLKKSCETGDKKGKYCKGRYKGYHCTKKPLHKGDHPAGFGSVSCGCAWTDKK